MSSRRYAHPTGWGLICLPHARRIDAVIDAARAHLAEIDNAPAVPERDGTVGRLREAIEDLDELEGG